MRSDNRDIRHMIYSQPEVWKLLTLDYILLTLLHLGQGGKKYSIRWVTVVMLLQKLYRKFDIYYFSSELSRQLNSTFSFIKENENCEELYEFSQFHRVFLNLYNIQTP